MAAVGGAAIPATPSSMRVLWAALVTDPRLRLTAYALSAVSFTAATILGPVLVSGLLLLGGPQAAVLVAAGLAGGGGVLFAAAPASRRWVPAAAPVSRRSRGLPGRGMRTLIAGNLAIGLAAGLCGVGVPAAAVALGTAALAGVFGAAGAAGDLCGGFVYGGRHWRLPLASRLGAVQGITTTTLLGDIAEPGALTGSYALLVSSGLAGSAAGYAVGGTLVSAAGIRSLFLVAGAVGLAAAGWYARRHRTLGPR